MLRIIVSDDDTERHRALRAEVIEDYAGVNVPLFNREELQDAVRSCRNNKSTVLDLLTAKIVKKFWSCISEYLLAIASQMMLEGRFVTHDGLLLVRGNTRIKLEAKAESTMKTVIAWRAEAQLTFSREKTKMTLFKKKYSAMRHPTVRMGGAPIGYNVSGRGEGCIREAHPCLEDFLGIALLNSMEDVQIHGGVGADLRMRGVLPIELLVRERVGRYWAKKNGLDLDEERRNGWRDSIAAWQVRWDGSTKGR
uniref:Uncharacterized protein n=1 Tax=Timema monikensis TaxID=170555 RepID=A0A7R9EL42_9NEOP|nr:unnamed protein product [Timema monikensis]